MTLFEPIALPIAVTAAAVGVVTVLFKSQDYAMRRYHLLRLKALQGRLRRLQRDLSIETGYPRQQPSDRAVALWAEYALGRLLHDDRGRDLALQELKWQDRLPVSTCRKIGAERRALELLGIRWQELAQKCEDSELHDKKAVRNG